MNQPTPIEQRLINIAMELLEIGLQNDPIAFRGALMGVVANCIGELPEEYWKMMCAIEPCGIPGCSCHLTISPATVEYLKKLRKDWQSTFKTQTLS